MLHLTIAAAGCLLAGCGRMALPSTIASPSASTASPPSPTISLAPTARPVPTAYVAQGRTAIDPPATAQLIVGRVDADGSYDVLAVELPTREDPVLLGSVRNLEARLPDRLGLARHSRAAVSETGFLIVTAGRVIVDEGDFRLAVFDLAFPNAEPWLIGGDEFRLVGDRLWLRGDGWFDIYDLPSRSPKRVTVPVGRSLVRDDVVPFFMTEAGDEVLLETRGITGPPYSLLGLDGVERPLAGESFAWTTAREQPFGPGRARILIGINCPEAPAYCIDREPGADTSVDVVGFADAAWVPGEESTAHVGMAGLGLVYEDGTEDLVVAFDRPPVRIVGFWSNLAIVPFGDDLVLGAVFVGTDALSEHPLDPESVIDVPGDVLLRSLAW